MSADIPRPDLDASPAEFETQLARWAKAKLAEALARADEAANDHPGSTAYARADAASGVYAELLDMIDPLGSRP